MSSIERQRHGPSRTPLAAATALITLNGVLLDHYRWRHGIGRRDLDGKGGKATAKRPTAQAAPKRKAG